MVGLGSKHPHEQLVDNNRCATLISKHANLSDQRYTTIEWLARKASKPWLQLAKQLNCAGRALCECQGGQSTNCADRQSKTQRIHNKQHGFRKSQLSCFPFFGLHFNTEEFYTIVFALPRNGAFGRPTVPGYGSSKFVTAMAQT